MRPVLIVPRFHALDRQAGLARDHPGKLGFPIFDFQTSDLSSDLRFFPKKIRQKRPFFRTPARGTIATPYPIGYTYGMGYTYGYGV